MGDHDESLEIGIAAGLDIPTAMVISHQDDDDGCPKRSSKKPAGCLSIAIIAAIVAVVLFYWL